jgi:hypothetical protein
MKWLELAATDFEEALQKSEGVVLIPVGIEDIRISPSFLRVSVSPWLRHPQGRILG